MDTTGLLTIGAFARRSWLSPRALRPPAVAPGMPDIAIPAGCSVAGPCAINGWSSMPVIVAAVSA